MQSVGLSVVWKDHESVTPAVWSTQRGTVDGITIAPADGTGRPGGWMFVQPTIGRSPVNHGALIVLFMRVPGPAGPVGPWGPVAPSAPSAPVAPVWPAGPGIANETTRAMAARTTATAPSAAPILPACAGAPIIGLGPGIAGIGCGGAGAPPP